MEDRPPGGSRLSPGLVIGFVLVIALAAAATFFFHLRRTGPGVPAPIETRP